MQIKSLIKIHPEIKNTQKIRGMTAGHQDAAEEFFLNGKYAEFVKEL
jgi:hypothetical protein